MTTYDSQKDENYKFIKCMISSTIRDNTNLTRGINYTPFISNNDKTHEDILRIQMFGLVKRLESANIEKIVLGLSGGLDSTLALLVAVRAFKYLKRDLDNIKCITMPGLGTSERTLTNSYKLAKALGVSIETISIVDGSVRHMIEIGINPETDRSITYENCQDLS